MQGNDNRVAAGHCGLVSVTSIPRAGVIRPAGPGLISFCAGCVLLSEDCGWK